MNNPLEKAEDTGSIPGPGRVHMPWGNEVRVPQLLTPVHPRAHGLQQEKQWQREAHAPQPEKVSMQQ